jgi:hypothetical protein
MIDGVYEVVATLKGITNRFPLRSFSDIKAFVVQTIGLVLIRTLLSLNS